MCNVTYFMPQGCGLQSATTLCRKLHGFYQVIVHLFFSPVAVRCSVSLSVSVVFIAVTMFPRVILKGTMIKKSQQKKRTSPSNYKERFFVLDTQDLKYSERRPGVSMHLINANISFEFDIIQSGGWVCTCGFLWTHYNLNHIHGVYSTHKVKIMFFQKKPMQKGCIELYRIKCVEIVCSDVPIPCNYKYPFQVRFTIFR